MTPEAETGEIQGKPTGGHRHQEPEGARTCSLGAAGRRAALPTLWFGPRGPGLRLPASGAVREGISVVSSHPGWEKLGQVWNSLFLTSGPHGWLPVSAAPAGDGEAPARSSPGRPLLVLAAARNVLEAGSLASGRQQGWVALGSRASLPPLGWLEIFGGPLAFSIPPIPIPPPASRGRLVRIPVIGVTPKSCRTSS